MAAPSGSFHAAPADNAPEDDLYAPDDADPSAASHLDDDALLDAKSKDSLPLQKRRRVTRACDECRRKKIKCDGKQPCTHCTVYSYECTYDQPSNRRRNPAPQYVEALETRLHKAEALLRVVLPDLNLDDPRFDEHATEQMLAAIKREKQQQPSPPAPNPVKPERRPSEPPQSGSSAPENNAAGDESLLESMVDNSGCLDLDDQGHWDYHGHTSGIIFIRRLRKQLGASDMQPPSMQHAVQQKLDSPKSTTESPQETLLPPTQDLPPRDIARRLCYNGLEHGCSLMRFVHEPSFYAMFDRVYDTPPEQFTNEENTFLPLLYIVISVGCLFSDDGASPLDTSGYETAIGQGFQFFKVGRQLLEITDCRDLTSLQAICFMVLFLQSSAKLSTCYSYVGIALRSALRLGLHRSVTANFNPIERELRRRVFWVVRKMDVYVSTLLGLPQMLSDDDIDQEYPLAVDGEFITSDGILPMPAGHTPLMAGANAHTRLSNIILKVVKYIYPVKNAQHRSKSDQRYVVSHSKIREIERDLQAWMEELPVALRPGTEVSPQLERIRQLLRISYAHVQVVMYRPFLHYVSSGSQARGVDRRSYACAAACVSVSRNIVHITTGLHKRGLLNGSYWFTMYTTYFAILSLLFFVLENPDSPTAKDGVLKDAMEGKHTLAGLAKKSMAADRCSQSLNCLFKNLPELLKNRQSSVKQVNLKRPAPSQSHAPSNRAGTAKSPAVAPNAPQKPPIQRSNTFPLQLLNRPSQEASNTPKTMDDNHHPTPPQTRAPNTPSWPPSTPEPALSTPSGSMVATPEPAPPSQLPSNASPAPSLSLHRREASGNNFVSQPPFANAASLPDLMPIMFPSDDPFAYPMQPMSTLEDGHFRQDGSTQFGGMAANDPNALGLSTPNMDSIANSNFPLFPHGTPEPMSMTLPSRLANQHPAQPQPPAPPINHSQMQSPVSHGSSTPGEAVNSPDLVSLPNQNFMWQGYNFQPQEFAPEQTAQPPMPSAGNVIDYGIGMDENNPMGMGLDLGISLDDIFGNNEACRPGGGYGTDDWTQWMNVG